MDKTKKEYVEKEINNGAVEETFADNRIMLSRYIEFANVGGKWIIKKL